MFIWDYKNYRIMKTMYKNESNIYVTLVYTHLKLTL